jgi:hypothetical protein
VFCTYGAWLPGGHTGGEVEPLVPPPTQSSSWSVSVRGAAAISVPVVMNNAPAFRIIESKDAKLMTSRRGRQRVRIHTE